MPFAIDDLASVGAHWSADQITGLSDTDPVDSMPNSIDANHLVQTGSLRPLYVAAGINSLPSVSFDGSTQWMATAASHSISATNFGFAIVTRFDTSKSYNTMLMRHDTRSAISNYATSDAVVASYAPSTNRMRHFFNSAAISMSTAAAPLIDASVDMLVSGVVGPRGISFFLQGELMTPGFIGSTVAVVDNNAYTIVGASSLGYLDGSVSEIVLWDETLLCERVHIEGVLAHKYGISLPTSHPFYAAAPTSAPGSGGGTPTTFHPLKSRALGA